MTRRLLAISAVIVAAAASETAVAEGPDRLAGSEAARHSAPVPPSDQARGFAGHLLPVERPFSMITPATPRPLVQIPFDWQTRPVATLRSTPSPAPYEPTPASMPDPARAPAPASGTSLGINDVKVEELPSAAPKNLVPATAMPAVPPLGLTTAGSAATAPAPGPVAAIPPTTAAGLPPDIGDSDRWRVSGSDTLKSALEAWADRAGWKIYYLTSSQYPMAPAEFAGDFPAAVERVFSAMSARRPLPTVTIHPANRSVVVRSIVVEEDQ